MASTLTVSILPLPTPHSFVEWQAQCPLRKFEPCFGGMIKQHLLAARESAGRRWADLEDGSSALCAQKHSNQGLKDPRQSQQSRPPPSAPRRPGGGSQAVWRGVARRTCWVLCHNAIAWKDNCRQAHSRHWHCWQLHSPRSGIAISKGRRHYFLHAHIACHRSMHDKHDF